MTITSHGEILALDGWRLTWTVTEDRGEVIDHSPYNRDHVIPGPITPRYLARRITEFVRVHCTPYQPEMVLPDV